MSTLYLDRRNLRLDIENGQLVVFEDGERRQGFPLRLLERLVILHTTALDSGVLTALGKAGVTTLVLNSRDHEKVAMVLGPAHHEAAIRLAQARYVLEPDAARPFVRTLLLAKLARQLRVLRRAMQGRPDLRRPLFKAHRQLEALLGTVREDAEADHGRLLGYEGQAARCYFAAFVHLFPPSLGFTVRQRRPPRDPVNAALSLGYTLLHFDAVRAAYAVGLDPMLGFYHRPAFGRASLAADLIEPLRPAVDAWVWQQFRSRHLVGDHFTREGEACLLGKVGRERFYRAWEEEAVRLRRWLRRQAQALARGLKTEGLPYLAPHEPE